MDWGEAIVQAIASSRLMILVFSSNANSSHQIRRGVERAASKQVPIVPFRIEDVQPSGSLEYFLGTPHWLDALLPPMEQHLQHLVQSARLLMAASSSSQKRVAEDVARESGSGEEETESGRDASNPPQQGRQAHTSRDPERKRGQ
jgi:hypothetical protein